MVRGTTRSKTPNRLESSLRIDVGIHNRFDVEVVDSRTGKIRQTARGFNTICNQLWTKLGSNTAYFAYIHYGDGSGSPSTGDSQLFSYLGGASATVNGSGIDNTSGTYWCRKLITLSETTAVGKTLTEVGVASGSAANSLCTHAMLKDMNGNPISIEKTDTDIVRIYATIFVHFKPEGYDGGSLRTFYWTNAGSEYRYSYYEVFAGVNATKPNKAQLCNKKLDTNTSGGFTSIRPDGASDVDLTHTWDVPNKTLIATMTRATISQGNSGGLTQIRFAWIGGSNSLYSTPMFWAFPGGSWFPHSEIVGESVATGDGSTKDFSLDFCFAKDVTIYVDGTPVEVSQVDYGPNNTSFQHYVDWIQPESTVDNHIPDVRKTGQAYRKSSYVFYNPMFVIGIASLTHNKNASVYVSEDLQAWVPLFTATSSGSATQTLSVPTDYQHYGYWKFVPYDPNTAARDYVMANVITPPSSYTGKTVHLAEAPPEGSVITADYKADCIAKNSNYVFDFEVRFQLGEYTEAQ